MKFYVRHDSKIASVLISDADAAGWVGFEFAKHNRDLVDDGWTLHYYTKESLIRISGGGIEGDGCDDDLVDLIRMAPKPCCPTCGHTCCRPPTWGPYPQPQERCCKR